MSNKTPVYLTREQIDFLWDVINKGIPVAEAVGSLKEDKQLDDLTGQLHKGANTLDYYLG